MSFAKKQRYFSTYLKSIDRKVLYTEPIFVRDVTFDDDAKIYVEGAADKPDDIADVAIFTNTLPVKIVKSKDLLYNISRFADDNFASQKITSVLLRNIVLGKKLDFKMTSISDRIMKIYNLIFETHEVKKYESVEFPKNVIKSVDKHIQNKARYIAVIDFNVSNQREADIASILKQLFFEYDDGESCSTCESSLIQYMKKRKYEVVIYGKIVYSMTIPPYCLMFKSL